MKPKAENQSGRQFRDLIYRDIGKKEDRLSD